MERTKCFQIDNGKTKLKNKENTEKNRFEREIKIIIL